MGANFFSNSAFSSFAYVWICEPAALYSIALLHTSRMSDIASLALEYFLFCRLLRTSRDRSCSVVRVQGRGQWSAPLPPFSTATDVSTWIMSPHCATTQSKQGFKHESAGLSKQGGLTPTPSLTASLKIQGRLVQAFCVMKRGTAIASNCRCLSW